MSHSSKFDIDLKYGRDGEIQVEAFLRGNGKYEVKRDEKVSKTGNVAIEVGKKTQNGEVASGLFITEADWWVIVLGGEHYADEVVMFIKTERLKKLVSDIMEHGKFVWGGDNKRSKLVLIPVQVLLE